MSIDCDLIVFGAFWLGPVWIVRVALSRCNCTNLFEIVDFGGEADRLGVWRALSRVWPALCLVRSS